MKKIIASLISITCVAILTVGSTIAFFSDTETSTDNVFTAGNLDIKVDSEAHYRDLVCAGGYWTNPNAVSCENFKIGNDDLSQSGSFRSFFINTAKAMPADEKKLCENLGFDFSLAKWEYNGYAYLPEGSANGTVVTGNNELAEWTSLVPVAGVIRKAAWDLSFYPGGYSGSAPWYCINGNKNICHDISYIEFCGNKNVCGNCILESGEECDNSLNVDDGFYCTADCKLKPLTLCAGTWEESDLKPGVHKFFEFSKLKPGDWGKDKISLHVYDYDAWGRLAIADVTDNENGCQDGEYYDEPDCSQDEIGELSKKIFFNTWLDDGVVPGFQNTELDKTDPGYDKDEGDNIRQDNEIEIESKNTISTDGEIWDMAPILALRFANDCVGYPLDGKNNGGACHGLAQDGHLVSGTTYYVGLAWDFPAQNDNSTQSDTLMFDLSLEVEQWRNNNEPF